MGHMPKASTPKTLSLFHCFNPLLFSNSSCFLYSFSALLSFFILIFSIFFYFSPTFFFFLNHQFITRRAKADRGSYFCNYVHRKQTQRKIKKEKEKKEKEKKQDIRTNCRRK